MGDCAMRNARRGTTESGRCNIVSHIMSCQGPVKDFSLLCPAFYYYDSMTFQLLILAWRLQVCWQHCPASPKPWVGYGAGCGSDAAECAMAITNQIIAPLVLAANIATFGFAEQVHSITASAQAAAKTVMISNKFFRAVGKVGRFLVKAVKSLKKLGEKIGRSILKKVTRLSNRMYNKFRASSPKWLSKLTRKLSCMDDWIAESDVSIFKRMWEKKHGTTTAKVNDVRKTISEATEASDMYATAFVEDFVQQVG